MSKNGAYTIEQHWNALVTAGEAVVEILKQGNVFAVLFQCLERLRHIIAGSSLTEIGKEGLLVNSIVVGQANEALDWFLDWRSASQRGQRLQHRKRNRYSCALEKFSSINTHFHIFYRLFISTNIHNAQSEYNLLLTPHAKKPKLKYGAMNALFKPLLYSN